MDLSLIVVRLKAQLGALRSVGVSVDLDAAIEGVVAMPAAFVLPLAESGRDMGLLSQTGDCVTQAFGVLHCVSNRRDAQGGAALADLKAHRLALRQALVGWVPDATTGEPVRFTDGRLLRLDGDGRLWWIDQFELITYYWSP
ncbi:MAG: hypothetical protein NTZ64_15120 [Polaromonas sp.]|nr:hypothetical protein [Polaromonas sp.]